MDPWISFVTLGVADVVRSTRFYQAALRLSRVASPPGVVFFDLGRVRLALCPRKLLAGYAGVPPEGSGFPGFALACNVGSAGEADQVLEDAVAAGGRIVKRAEPADWGGYAGYFADPDEFLWEVAWNPRHPFEPDRGPGGPPRLQHP